MIKAGAACRSARYLCWNFKQSVGARNRVGKGCTPARQATQPGGIGSLDSIFGLLKVRKFGLRN